jgi:hypothetical protein
MIKAPLFVSDSKFFGKEPDGMCGLERAKKAGFSFGDPAKVLIPLVVSGHPQQPPRLSSLAIFPNNLN